MFRSLPKRAVLAWLLRRLGPPPPPPRRHFAKDAQRRATHPASGHRRVPRRRGQSG